MKIYTSYFGNLKEIKKQGLTPIGIAIFPPRFYSGISYKKLAPEAKMIHWPEKQYTPVFNQMLSKLNPSLVLEELKSTSKDQDIVLLCYEKPGDFCHRRLVAEWLKKHIAQEIPELSKKENLLFDISKQKKTFEPQNSWDN
jgi:hypothetical protein